MALTRSLLKGMGLTDEQVSSIIEAHSETVEGLKAERDKYKAEAEKLPDVQNELDTLKNEGWKAKYEKEHKEYSDYKADIASKETLGKVKAAFRQLLLDKHVGEKHIDSIMRVTDFGSMKLDGEKLADADKLSKQIESDWSGFITSTETKGANVETPPAGGMKGMTRSEIYAKDEHGRYKLDATARQEQLAKLMTSGE